MYQLASYLKEREGIDSLVTEKGFVSYIIAGEECYIKDIWVNKDFRKLGVAAALADQVVEIALKQGCKFLSGTVVPSATGSTDSLKVLLAYGFTLHSASNNFIVFRKEI